MGATQTVSGVHEIRALRATSALRAGGDVGRVTSVGKARLAPTQPEFVYVEGKKEEAALAASNLQHPMTTR